MGGRVRRRLPYHLSTGSIKNEPIFEEVELIQATPSYARVRMAHGCKATVSLRDVAPIGDRRKCNRTDLTESDNDFVSYDDACSSVRNQASEPQSPAFVVSEA